MTADGRRTLALVDDQEAAQRQAEGLTRLIRQLGTGGDPAQAPGVKVDGSDGRVQVSLDIDGRQTPVAEFASQAEAQTSLENFSLVASDRYGRRRAMLLSLPVGLLLGAAGTAAVWARSRRTPDFIARSGVARTFQNIRLFQNMTVLENVLIGMDRRFHAGGWRIALRTPRVRKEETDARGAALEYLQFVGLESRAKDLAKNLSYGEQRRLEIARALATEPRVLLLDEPAAGMNPAESGELAQLIDRIRQRGLSVLLIEHHMRVVMGISDRIAVLDYGTKIAEGTPAEIRANPRRDQGLPRR